MFAYFQQCDKFEVSTFTISCFAAIIMLSRVILTIMAIAHALCQCHVTRR